MSSILLPLNPTLRSIVEQLNDTISRAEALYASVCFWSIGPAFFDADLAELLRQPGSFCIVDIHTPTNVDKINAFYQLGATQFFLFFKELQPKRIDAYLERHLMHTKMLLFDLPNGKAELWIGSHNFTRQALKGINHEASLIISCYQDDMLYRQVVTYLHSILTEEDCHRFDPNLIDTYKRLQGLPDEEIESGPFILPLAWNSTEWPSPATLANLSVALVGHNQDEDQQFNSMPKDAVLAVRAHDSATGQVRYFSAICFGANRIDPNYSSSYDIELGERYLAVRQNIQLPFISPLKQKHGSETLRQFRYWVSLYLLDELPKLEFQDKESPPEAKWQTDYKANQELIRAEMLDAPAPYQLSDVNIADRNTYLMAPDDSQTRLARWFELARRRRVRSEPPAPNVKHAVFNTNSFKQLPGFLAKLDQEFSPENLPAIREQYEAPLRETYYLQTDAANATDHSDQGPQVRKLLRRYRLRCPLAD